MAIAANHERLYFISLACCKVAKQCAKQTPQQAGILALEAGILNTMGRFEMAQSLAQAAVKESRGYNAQAYVQGATAFFRLEKFDDALNLLQKGLDYIQDARRDELEALRVRIQDRVSENVH